MSRWAWLRLARIARRCGGVDLSRLPRALRLLLRSNSQPHWIPPVPQKHLALLQSLAALSLSVLAAPLPNWPLFVR